MNVNSEYKKSDLLLLLTKPYYSNYASTYGPALPKHSGNAKVYAADSSDHVIALFGNFSLPRDFIFVFIFKLSYFYLLSFTLIRYFFRIVFGYCVILSSLCTYWRQGMEYNFLPSCKIFSYIQMLSGHFIIPSW